MKRLLALFLTLILLGGLCARGDETIQCVLNPEDLFDTVTLYKEVGGDALGEYRAYVPAELLNRDGDWALVSIGGLTGFVAADKLTPVPNPNSMPDSLFRLSATEDMTLNGSYMPAGVQLNWLGTSALGLYHVAWWEGGRGWQYGFAEPDRLRPAALRGYGGLKYETPLRDQPHEDAPALITLMAGLRMHCEIDPDWCRVTTETGHEGYVPTGALAFSMGLSMQKNNCPIVTLQRDEQLLSDDRQTPLADLVKDNRAVLLARDEQWSLISVWDRQYTGWVRTDAVAPTPLMRTSLFSNGLPTFALAITAPRENSQLEPGLGLFVQGETETAYQVYWGLVDKSDVLLIPIVGENSRLCTLTLSENESFTWQGETFTGPGAYDIALFPDEEAPENAQFWALGDTRLTPAAPYESGSGRILGLHAWAQECIDLGLTLRVTGMPGGGIYTVRDLGGRDLADRSLVDGKTVYQGLPADAYLTFTNCFIQLIPGNG